MQNLALCLIAFSLVIAFISLYKDLKKLKNWRIETNEPRPTIVDSTLESVCYIDPVHPVHPVTTACEAASSEATTVGLGHFLDNAGHFFHH